MLDVLGLVWMLAASAVLVAWSRFNAHIRRLEAIDEGAHIEGRTG